MNKEKIVELIDKDFSQREIAETLEVSQTNLRYWLEKFGLKTNKKKFNKRSNKKVVEKKCAKCNETKNVYEFYKRHENGRSHEVTGYCKSCSNKYHSERVRKVKLKMIDYKGGKCEKCALALKNSHYSVFEFHHLNPKEKDVNFAKIKYQKWEKIKIEIDKCMLVCANCHRIEHSLINGW
jgi:hypothetical protein